MPDGVGHPPQEPCVLVGVAEHPHLGTERVPPGIVVQKCSKEGRQSKHDEHFLPARPASLDGGG